MSTAIDAAGLEAVRADLRALLDGTPAAAGAHDDVALVEQLALGLQVPFNLPDAPPELAAVVVKEFERRDDPGAAGMLGAISVFAHQPLAGLARQALTRLRERGVVSPVAEQIGTLEVSELRCVAAGEGAYYLIGILARPGSRRQQVVSVLIEPDGDGEVIADGLLTPPGKPASVRRFLRKEVGAGGSGMSAADALERLRTAAGHMIAHGLAAGEGAADAVPLLARALAGDAQALANISYELSDPVLDADPADSEHTQAAIEALLAEFASLLARDHGDSRLLEHIDLVWSMLDWKAHHADGRLGNWTEDELQAFLLGFCPLAVPAGEQRIAALPECVLAFLRFLDAIGRLGRPGSLEELERAVIGARGRFEREMRDRGAWGFAKSVAMEKFPEEGIDPKERTLIDAWLTDAVSHSPDRPDPALKSATGLATRPAANSRPASDSKRAKRRSAGRARKHNRP